MIPTSLEAQSSCDIIAIRNGTGAGPASISSPRGCEVRGEALAGSAINQRLPITIPDPFLADILKPYRAQARYLKSAEITHFRDQVAPRDGTSAASLLTGTGRFSIPESCYIDDTGHFNAVEFNICYNQLAYAVFGKSVEAGLLHSLRRGNASVPSFAEFKHHQLPSMLIVRIEGVRFFKQMRSDDFRGELNIDKVSSKGPAWFFFTSIAFSDCEGVKAQGSVVLAFSPTFGAIKH
jgi:hypothetical protein